MIDEINLKKVLGSVNNLHSSDLKPDNNLNVNANNMLIFTNKVIKYNLNSGIEELCKACIKSKYIKIVKLKKIMLMTRKATKNIHQSIGLTQAHFCFR